ncbi:M14 family metallopeptidase [Novosphingobium profundi]|uniref:M14 family metallopeptidase n=1 Tax=Novosphingobium profundi TaxID=1774954 RepID=UPI001BD918FB|nr:M14 family metallopeptidase [Novosphingobium profundi]MBT0670737.1 M14 family metallopeptidase [Novosphingobium profundi]
MTPAFWPPERRAPLPPVQPWDGRSQALIRASDDPFVTPAEIDGLETTPTYAETCAFLERLAAASPLIRLHACGTSVEGRAITLVVASRDHEAAMACPREGAPVRVYVECGIHPGEIDGKDAGLMLLRDIAVGGKDDLLAGCDWYFVPVLNPDGHERRSVYSRPNQRGPLEQGWRASAQGLNLNRDFVKAHSPEVRAVLSLLGTIDPDLFLDIHVTDGLDYQYDITFGFQDALYSTSPALSTWLEEVYRPCVNAAMTAQDHIPGPLILAADDRRPELGLMLPAFPPRFSHGQGDIRHIATVLVENHSLKPVRQRILGTYVLIEASLRAAVEHAETLRTASRADRARRAETAVLTWDMAEEPVRTQTFHPIASEFYDSAASGAREVRWLGTPLPAIEAPVLGSTPAITIERPRGYWVPASEREVLDRLAAHGIERQITTDWHEVEVELQRLCELTMADTVSERCVKMSARVAGIERRTERFAPGSAWVPTDQRLGDLAILMLEPVCADSFFAQGYVTGMLDPVEYMEAYVIAPMADEMLETDPVLRAEFTARLASDNAFAADPMARLKWFYLRSPYADERHMLYPIGRVPA